jgi:serine/threonine-protein kinase
MFAKLVAGIALAYGIVEVWDGIVGHVEIIRSITIVGIGVYSLVLGFGMKRITLAGWQVYVVGLIYLVCMAFMVSFTRHSLPVGELRGWSGATILALLFPVLVPCSPRRASLASTAVLIAALVAFGLTRLLGQPILWTSGTARIFMGEILAIPIAGFVSSVVYGLGRELESARRLGAYALDERLGQGGMGEVWKGHHSLLARPAAIKLIRTDAMENTTPEVRLELLKRFEREAQATAVLKCPHTVNVFDFGISDEGAFYYVMELLDGIDLHVMVARHGPMPPSRVIEILKQACLSLSEAHGQGMVHRDIKPSNMVVCRLGEEVDFVKVLDFGLVTPSSVRPADGRLTSVGGIAGTPAFISPEQGRGDLEIDGRSDLYALGCVAYWLLSGQLVFEGSPMDVIASHIKEDPRPVSTATLTPIPEGLERVIMQCLEKDPSNRPSSARAILQALESIEVAQPWTQQEAREWWSTHIAQVRVPGDAASTFSLPAQ